MVINLQHPHRRARVEMREHRGDRLVAGMRQYLLAGVVCGMLAKASHDLGDTRAALTQARTAYVC
ncbi:MAG: hypothetical protein ACRDPT_08080 [Streptomycetales bacterium]